MSAVQGSPEWLAERCGFVTASRVADIIATTKSGPAASRANYLAQLVAERLTGTVEQSYSNAAMQWGTDNEPIARAAYEVARNVLVDECGFIKHPSVPWSGASPDGLIADGLTEFKCPNTATHLDYLLAGIVPAKYKPQMAWQCACTKREWCDFVSFDPRMPEHLQLFIIRYEPGSYIAELEDKVITFLGELDAVLAKLAVISDARRAVQKAVDMAGAV